MNIDLNSDVGESFGRWTLGDDEAILALVTSVNIACGFHGGDARVMRQTVRLAAAKNLAIGAHVSYRDLAGFGRRFMDVDPSELADEVIYQIGALEALARSEGVGVAYVKPHGALGNAIFAHEAQAQAVVQAIADYDKSLPLLTTAGAIALEMAEDAGVRGVGEAFADRAYGNDGSLVSRKLPGAVLHDPNEITQRVLRMLETGKITTAEGGSIEFNAESICLHGDTDGAVKIAAAVRKALDESGAEVAPFISPVTGP